jgi:hypothetical protein
MRVYILALVCCLAIGVRGEEAPPKPRSAADVKLDKRVRVEYIQRPLAEVMGEIGREIDLPIYLDPRALHAEGVTSDTPITLNLATDIGARSALNIILHQLRLTYRIDPVGDRVTIVSRLDGPLSERIYDLRPLLGPTLTKPWEAQVQPDVQPPRREAIAEIAKLLQETVEPTSWKAKENKHGRGKITLIENQNAISVLQIDEVHSAVEDLLDQLTRLQELQVLVDVKSIALPRDQWEAIVGKRDSAAFTLTDKEHEGLLAAIESSPRKYMLYNGQSVDVPLDKAAVTVQAVVTVDRRQTRLLLSNTRAKKIAAGHKPTEIAVNSRGAVAWFPFATEEAKELRGLLLVPRILTIEIPTSRFEDAQPYDDEGCLRPLQR